jgi:hypothetical protein
MKVEVKLDQRGQNLNLIIDGEKVSKRFPDKEERENVKAMVKEYNSSDKVQKPLLEKIRKAMQSEVKKVTTKKKTTTKKKAEPKVEKVEVKESLPVKKGPIFFRQMGLNILITVGDKRFSKKVDDKETRAKIKSMAFDMNSDLEELDEIQFQNGLAHILDHMPLYKTTTVEPVEMPKLPKPKKSETKVESKVEEVVEEETVEETPKKKEKKKDKKKDKKKAKKEKKNKEKKVKKKVKKALGEIVGAVQNKAEKTEEQFPVLTATQVAAYIHVIIDGTKHSKKFNTAVQRSNVMTTIRTYNNPTTAPETKKELLEVIKESMSKKSVTTSSDEAEALENNQIKEEKVPEAVNVLTKEEQIAAAKKLLEENGMEVKQRTNNTSTRTRSRGGEY